MAMSTLVKPPDPLNLDTPGSISSGTARSYYKVAAKINKEEGEVRVAHLLNVIGKDVQDVYQTFTLSDDDRKNVVKVFEAFES